MARISHRYAAPFRAAVVASGSFFLTSFPPPLHAQVELENTWVRVVREHLAPHQVAPEAEHPPTLVVYLSGERTGTVRYLQAGRSALKNRFGQPMEAVLIELKPARIHSAPVALDPVKLDPLHHIVEFENDRVRVLRTILVPRLKSPMHEHPPYVVVYLTELHTTMRLADGRMVDNPRRPGEVAWRDRLKHETENIGPRTAEEIQVELK